MCDSAKGMREQRGAALLRMKKASGETMEFASRMVLSSMLLSRNRSLLSYARPVPSALACLLACLFSVELLSSSINLLFIDIGQRKQQHVRQHSYRERILS